MGNFFTGDGIEQFTKRIYSIAKTIWYHIVNSLIWRQNWLPASGSPRFVSGRIINVLYLWTVYMCCSSSNFWSKFSFIFSFVNCEEKDYYRVVSVEQLGFDCFAWSHISSTLQETNFRSYSILSWISFQKAIAWYCKLMAHKLTYIVFSIKRNP